MKKTEIKLWKLGVLTFLPFLGITSPYAALALIFIYFFGWVIYLYKNA